MAINFETELLNTWNNSNDNIFRYVKMIVKNVDEVEVTGPETARLCRGLIKPNNQPLDIKECINIVKYDVIHTIKKHVKHLWFLSNYGIDSHGIVRDIDGNPLGIVRSVKVYYGFYGEDMFKFKVIPNIDIELIYSAYDRIFNAVQRQDFDTVKDTLQRIRTYETDLLNPSS